MVSKVKEDTVYNLKKYLPRKMLDDKFSDAFLCVTDKIVLTNIVEKIW